MTIDRDLTVSHLARRPGILVGHADRVTPLLLKPRIIQDEHAIPCAGQGLHLDDSLPVEGGLIPDHVGQQVVELLLIGLGIPSGRLLPLLFGMYTRLSGRG
jgi:hypothetical protein